MNFTSLLDHYQRNRLRFSSSKIPNDNIYEEPQSVLLMIGLNFYFFDLDFIKVATILVLVYFKPNRFYVFNQMN